MDKEWISHEAAVAELAVIAERREQRVDEIAKAMEAAAIGHDLRTRSKARRNSGVVDSVADCTCGQIEYGWLARTDGHVDHVRRIMAEAAMDAADRTPF